MDAVTLFVVVQWRVTADKEYAITREEQKRFDALYARLFGARSLKPPRPQRGHILKPRASDAQPWEGRQSH
jgi:hypothetical protein